VQLRKRIRTIEVWPIFLNLKMIIFGMQVEFYFLGQFFFDEFLFFLAALEGRIAASYASAQKPKRQAQKQTQFFRQNSLIRSKQIIF